MSPITLNFDRYSVKKLGYVSFVYFGLDCAYMSSAKMSDKFFILTKIYNSYKYIRMSEEELKSSNDILSKSKWYHCLFIEDFAFENQLFYLSWQLLRPIKFNGKPALKLKSGTRCRIFWISNRYRNSFVSMWTATDSTSRSKYTNQMPAKSLLL